MLQNSSSSLPTRLVEVSLTIILFCLGPPAYATECSPQQSRSQQAEAPAKVHEKALKSRESGDLAEAIEFFKKARELYHLADNRNAEIEMLRLLGQTTYLQGKEHKNEAVAYLYEALPLAHGLGDPHGEGLLLFDIRLLHYRSGDKKDALKALEQAITKLTLDRLGNRAGELSALSHLGSFYGSIGDWQRARRSYLEALEILTTTDSYRVTARAYSRLASVYRMANESSAERDALQAAMIRYEGLKDHEGMASTLFALGINYLNDKDTQKALESLNDSVAHSRGINDIAAQSYTLGKIGRIHVEQNNQAKAAEAIASQIVLADLVNDSSLKAHVLLDIGISYLSLKMNKDTLKYFHLAHDSFGRVGHNHGASHALTGIALAQENLGDQAAALKNYLDSISILEKMRTSGRFEELQSSIAGLNADNYANAIHLSLKLGQQQQAFALSERARARSLLDQLGNVRIDPRSAADPKLVTEERALRAQLSELEHQQSLERSGRTREGSKQGPNATNVALEISALQEKYHALHSTQGVESRICFYAHDRLAATSRSPKTVE